ncbi:hypothetical protein WG66_006700 [Moniliophthora roreri]|nr:hypothetical protein WG66_006700 [Moniliophthora roreri]
MSNKGTSSTRTSSTTEGMFGGATFHTVNQSNGQVYNGINHVSNAITQPTQTKQNGITTDQKKNPGANVRS